MDAPGVIADVARGWAIRVSDPAFSDWDGLTDWLAEDPAHVVAYNEAIDDEAWADSLFASPQPRPIAFARVAQDRRTRARLLRRGGGALAVAVALLAGVGGWLTLGGNGQDVTTAAGERRTLALADGSSVVLNGATHIKIGTREAELLGGEALFQIRHDAAHPFVVRAGAARLVDAGTVFNVIAAGAALDVAVAQGAVLYHAGARDIRLDAGKALSSAADGAEPVLRATDPETVGSWNAGFLHYTAAPLAQIATDLARNLGEPVRVGEDARAQRFTGTLAITGTPDAVLAKTGPLLGVRFVKDGVGWRMVSRDGTAR
ncbi:FecR family protein [Sphingomonas sp. PL20]|uniref:FecR family protein n=1 Tax=Sphingomonas sp. PL20 TaxID=2760712 RepID=UPI001AEA2201